MSTDEVTKQLKLLNKPRKIYLSLAKSDTWREIMKKCSTKSVHLASLVLDC
jgi:hypothetical protein